MNGYLTSGVAAALAAAALFGASTPFAKLLLGQTSPWLLAALLYLGSGIGLWLVRRLRRTTAVTLPLGEWAWLAAVIVAGGMVGPVLLMTGLSQMPASGASLLLNAEGVLTALLAWLAFKENFATWEPRAPAPTSPLHPSSARCWPLACWASPSPCGC
jgi:drug/metabolite transporter (DMT)-like permease